MRRCLLKGFSLSCFGARLRPLVQYWLGFLISCVCIVVKRNVFSKLATVGLPFMFLCIYCFVLWIKTYANKNSLTTHTPERLHFRLDCFFFFRSTTSGLFFLIKIYYILHRLYSFRFSVLSLSHHYLSSILIPTQRCFNSTNNGLKFKPRHIIDYTCRSHSLRLQCKQRLAFRALRDKSLSS